MHRIFYRIKDLFLRVGIRWDKQAVSKEEADAFAQKYINKEATKYQEGSHTVYSIEYRLAHYGESINRRYRKGKAEETDKQIEDALNERKTDADLIVYRGVYDEVFRLMEENAKNHKDADLFEVGYMATSLVKGHEVNHKKKLRILVPAGSKCVYMGNVNREPDYYEVMIQRNAALKIISIDKEYINCELISTL